MGEYADLIASEVTCAIVLVILQFGLLQKEERCKSTKWLSITCAIGTLSLLDDAYCYYLINQGTSRIMIVITDVLSYIVPMAAHICFGYYCVTYIREKAKVNPWVFRGQVILSILTVTYELWYICWYRYASIPSQILAIDFILCALGNLYFPIYVIMRHKVLGWKTTLLMGPYGFIAIGITIFGMHYGKNYAPVAAAIFYIIASILLRNNYVYEKELKQREAMERLKTKVILSQIQPHFIYNTLSSIACLCTENPPKAKDLTIHFSNYIRMNLKTFQSNTLVLFEDEIQHTEIYLQIEKERFGEKLQYELDICASDFMIPPLTLQPLVENAVKHGICGRASGGHLKISSYETEEGYEITIEDDGVGFDPEQIDWNDGTHIGIQNTRERLLQLCNGILTIQSIPGKGTTATIFIREEL